MSESLGLIMTVEAVTNFQIEPIAPLHGNEGARLGFIQMLNALTGNASSMDGYKITTDQHGFYVLIDNEQSCCESWGYLSSDDDFQAYIGSELLEVCLTDTALNQQAVEKSDYYDDNGGIQFVDFKTNRGVLQFAVYNSHNGYYGHGILVAKDNEIILNTTL